MGLLSILEKLQIVEGHVRRGSGAPEHRITGCSDAEQRDLLKPDRVRISASDFLRQRLGALRKVCHIDLSPGLRDQQRNLPRRRGDSPPTHSARHGER